MAHNAAMNTQMTERFNVSGATLVKLFGSAGREQAAFELHADGVRDTGVRSALYGRVFFVALGLVGALGTAAVYGVGAVMVVDGGISTGTLVALAALVTRIYQPLTGLDERARRPDDVDGEFRAGVRSARRTRGDPGTSRRDRSDRPGRCGRVRQRRVPLPARERRRPCRRWSRTPASRSTPIPTSTCSTACR